MSEVEGGSLGKYLIVGKLGRGAMGVVYDARDPVIDRRVAIKTIPLATNPESDEAEAVARFRREAQAAGRLHHPNLVSIFDYGETDQVAYIVMEFVDGTSLKAMLDAQQRFTPSDAARIMEGLLAGLQYSHDRGVVHRDIKPANIMVTRDGTVKIADFGIARIESSQMTQAGTVLGTPAYMSPEQIMGQTVDLRSDLYSAGVLLYQLLTGERPFEGSMSSIMHKALTTEPPLPSAISVTAPIALDKVVTTAMAKRPDQRFASAADFAAALRTAMLGPPPPAASEAPAGDATIVSAPARADRTPHPSTAPAAAPIPEAAPESVPAPPAPPRRKPGVLLLAGGALAVVAVTGVAVFVAQQQPRAVAPPMVLPPPALRTPPAPPASGSALAPAPKLLPAPANTPPAAPSRDQIASAAAAAIAGAKCALVGGDVGADGSISAGGVAERDQIDGLRRALAGAAASAPLRWQVASFSGPYCDVLETLRPFSPQFGAVPSGMILELQGHPSRLLRDQFIVPQITLPQAAGYLEVDYFSSDGELLHVYPRPGVKPAYREGGSVVVLGDPAAKNVEHFPVGKPYGTDLIVAIATSSPLFARARPDDTVSAYLPALRQALATIQSHGGKVDVRAMVVETADQ